MATITSTPTGDSLTVSGNTQVSGTISWSKPTVPSGATISSCVLTGKATASMSKGSATITVNGTTVSSGSNFTINLGTANNTTSVTTTAKGGNKNAAGTISFSNLVYTVTYEMPKQTYTVTFKDWNGTILKTQTVEEGSSATAPSNPTRDGYKFTGWDVAFNNITSDLTVTAQYTQLVYYTVTFVNWNGNVLKTQTVEEGSSASAPSNPTRVGYTFTGWDKAFTNITGDLTVTAQYTINNYTVTFKDWDGTVLKTQTVNHGSSATAPSNPVREEYDFIGWDKSFTNITSNLDITAQYKKSGIMEEWTGLGTVATGLHSHGTIDNGLAHGDYKINLDWQNECFDVVIQDVLNYDFRYMSMAEIGEIRIGSTVCSIAVNESFDIYIYINNVDITQNEVLEDIYFEFPTTVRFTKDGIYLIGVAGNYDTNELSDVKFYLETSFDTSEPIYFYEDYVYNPGNHTNKDFEVLFDLVVNELPKEEPEVTKTLIVQYKFDKSIYENFIPEFNSEFTNYEIVDEYLDTENIITRTIYSNDLPTIIRFGDSEVTDISKCRCLLELCDINTDRIINMDDMFAWCTSMKSINTDHFNTNNVTSMYAMFYGCYALTSLDISNFDTSNVTNMSYMFAECSLTSLDISNWDTSSVTDMSFMFYNALSLTSLNLSNWDVSNVNNMMAMFFNCQPLTSLDISNWGTSNVTNISYMFANCISLTSLNISNWNISNVTDTTIMFYDCNAINEVTCNASTLNKIQSELPTRSEGNEGIIICDDLGDFDTSTLESKYWNVISLEEPEVPEIPVDYTIALRPVNATEDSGYNNSWTDIANTYDTNTSTSGTIIVTGSSQSGFKRKYVDTIFNFDNPIPANATINSAVLTIRAKQSATTNLNITVSIGSQEVISSTLLTSSAANYTADISNYVKDLNQLNINLTSAATSNRTFTLYDVRVDVEYTAYETPKPTYTVTFKDWDGFVLKTQKVEEGSSATAPSNPTRAGYIFIGWDVAFDNITSNLTVTAQYEIQIQEEPEGPKTSCFRLGDILIDIMYLGGDKIEAIFIGENKIF